MKKLEFETNKGRFLLIDSKDAPSSFNRYLRDIEKELNIQLTTGYKLSEINEEQASQIVDYPFELEVADSSVLVFKDYEDGENTYTSSIDSLYSLLKSKGVHLFENPHKDHEDKNLELWYEDLTFKNPYIFKI